MSEKKLIAGIGSALIDILAYEDDEFVAATGSAKGGMTLVDNAFIDDLLNNKYNQNLEYVEDNQALEKIPVKLFVLDTNTNEEILINDSTRIPTYLLIGRKL